MIKKFLILALFISFNSISQSLEEVAQAASIGLISREDVFEELNRRGMTEEDARRMAKVYGISYDEYLAKYILDPEKLPSSNISTTSTTASDVMNMTEGSRDILGTPTTLSIDTSYEAPSNFGSEPTSIMDSYAAETAGYFGYNVFLNNPFADKEYLVGNIDEGYILAPGDVIRIYVFGDNSFQAEVVIDLNGNIFLPGIGMFFASGYTFKSIKSRLTDFLGRSFSGLVDSPQRSFIDVSLTQIRPVKVTVLGEINTPGPHLVSGFATVLNSLYSSGGIKNTGSLRNIQVYRNNKLKKTIDLYDYVTKGSLDDDIRLMNNDIIYVPIRNNTIEIIGSVNKPAIYELKDNENFNELIEFAGGFTTYASVDNININRIKPIDQRSSDDKYFRFLTSVNFYELSKNKENFKLFDGDLINVSSILDQSTNQVIISGNVFSPGEYSLDKYQDLKSLINNAAKGIRPKTYMEKIDIISDDLETGLKSFKTFNLNDILTGKEKYNLNDNDNINVYSLEDVYGQEDLETVEIEGFVDNPQTVIWRENLSIYDLIFSSVPVEAKDFKSEVLTSKIDVRSFNKETGLFISKTYNLDKILNKELNFLLKPRDKVILYSKSINFELNPTVTSTGSLVNPGTFQLQDSMIVEDLIIRSGGFLKYTNKQYVNISRINLIDPYISRDKFKKTIDINYILGNKDKSEVIDPFYLSDRDIVDIDLIPGINQNFEITVLGEVMIPGNILLRKKYTSLNEITDEFGGFSKYAYLPTSYIIRDSTTLAFKINNQTMNYDFLQTGDIINIESVRGNVIVNGAIENEKIFNWKKGKRSKYYIRNSGGKSKILGGKATVTYKNGMTKKIGGFRNPIIHPNSEIFINFLDEPKEPFFKRLGEGISNSLDKVLQISTLATTTLTTFFLINNLKD